MLYTFETFSYRAKKALFFFCKLLQLHSANSWVHGNINILKLMSSLVVKLALNYVTKLSRRYQQLSTKLFSNL